MVLQRNSQRQTAVNMGKRAWGKKAWRGFKPSCCAVMVSLRRAHENDEKPARKYRRKMFLALKCCACLQQLLFSFFNAKECG